MSEANRIVRPIPEEARCCKLVKTSGVAHQPWRTANTVIDSSSNTGAP